MAEVPREEPVVEPTDPRPVYQPSSDNLGAFGGAQAAALKNAAPQIDAAGNDLTTISTSMQRQKAAVAFSNAVNQFKADPTIAPERAVANGQVNGQDLTDIGDGKTPGAIENYTNNSQSKANAAADAMTSQFGQAWGGKLASTLQAIHNGNVTQVGGTARAAQNAQVGAVADQNMQPTLQAAYQGDTPLPTLLKQAADQADLVASGNGPAAGVAAHNKYMNSTLNSVYQGQISRASSQEDLDAVRTSLATNKGLFTDASTAIALQQDLAAKQHQLAEMVKGTPSDPNSPTNIVAGNIGALTAGSLAPAKEWQVLQMMDQLSKPHQDPVTQQIVPGTNMMAMPGVAAAKVQWEARHPGLTMPGTPPAATSAGGAAQASAYGPAPAASPAGTATAPAPAQGPTTSDPGRNGGKPTLYDLNEQHSMTGLLNAGARVAHYPGVFGEAVGGQSQQAADAATAWIAEAKQAVATTDVAGSNRTNESQLKDTDALLDKLDPHLFESATNYRQSILDVDDALASIQSKSEKAGANTSLSPDEQKQARGRANSIQDLRERLGAPLRVDEARARNPNPKAGTPFRKADGTIGYAVGPQK